MRARISKICLVVFAVMLVLGGFLLSTAGNYWPWFAVTAVFAVVPVVVGPRFHRLLGVAALALSILLIAGDYEAGKRVREARNRASAAAHTPQQTTEGRTNHSSEPPPALP